ncbi:hypothetical protein [Prauserella sp. PE36]|nr:hypothetical protein [Prauserella sp. PE36]
MGSRRVHLSGAEQAALGGGLSKDVDTDRKLYVAGTRAHRRTAEVVGET